MVLQILRGVFIVLIVAITALYVLEFQEEHQRFLNKPAIQHDSQGNVVQTELVDFSLSYSDTVLMMAGAIALAAIIIAIDVSTPHKKLSAMSGVLLGLIAGLLVAYVLGLVIDLVGRFTVSRFPEYQKDAFLDLLRGVKVFVGMITCYICISLVLQTKDDFRFVIPYVEFAKEIRGTRPTLVDTSVIIDGRILEIVDTNIMQGSLIVPKFVLDELQQISDSADSLKRSRGRRGLDLLQKLQTNTSIPINIEDREIEGTGVDQKLVALAQKINARIMTTDFNLAKVAEVRNIDVININSLSLAVKPDALPGEPMHVKIVKAGEGPTQGVGYLDDGTMVVVENAKDAVGKSVDLVVTSSLQTSAGRMIFGRHKTKDA